VIVTANSSGIIQQVSVCIFLEIGVVSSCQSWVLVEQPWIPAVDSCLLFFCTAL